MAESFTPSTFADHDEELKMLSRLGFTINPLNKTVSNINEAWEYADMIHSSKESLSYEIDGVVIKVKDNRLVSSAGVVGKTPRAWAAIKFAGEDVTTRITNIVWQVGRTGKVTPVAELEPTLLAGTTVKRATLHNYKEVVESNIHLGDTVVIHKAGDIIPEIKQILLNLRQFSATAPGIPTHCPVCNTPLAFSQTGIDLVCKNSECKAQVLGRLAYYTQRSIANIGGFSEKTIEKFIDLYNVRDIHDLYDLPYDKIFELEGFGQKSIEKLKESIENSKKISVARFFAGLGIDGVGLEVAQLLLTHLPQITTESPQEEQGRLL